MTYKREYYQFKDMRVSIDRDIKYSLFSGRILGSDQNSIVEIKASINKDVDDLVADFPFQRTRFSKYCNAIKSLNLV